MPNLPSPTSTPCRSPTSNPRTSRTWACSSPARRAATSPANTSVSTRVRCSSGPTDLVPDLLRVESRGDRPTARNEFLHFGFRALIHQMPGIGIASEHGGGQFLHLLVGGVRRYGWYLRITGNVHQDRTVGGQRLVPRAGDGVIGVHRNGL